MVKLQRAIARILPPRLQVVSGQAVINELSNAIDSQLSFISTAAADLRRHRAVRRRLHDLQHVFDHRRPTLRVNWALLRVLGASRRQVFRSVVGEAAITGLTASPDRTRIGGGRRNRTQGAG